MNLRSVIVLTQMCLTFFLTQNVDSVDPLVKEISIAEETKVIPRDTRRCRQTEKHPDDKEFRIAWLAPQKEFHNFSAETSVGALKLALAYIDQYHVLNGWKVRAKWYDSNCDSKDSLAAAVEAVENFDPDVIIGPPCSTGLMGVAQLGSIWNLPVFSWVSDLLDFKDKDKYTTLVRLSGPMYALGLMGVAQLGSIWNLPVFSWVSDLLDFKDKDKYSTLVRLSGPMYALAETMRQVGIYFQWKNFALIYDKEAPYDAVATALRESTIDKGYTIKSAHYVTKETKDSDIEAMLLQIRKFARVIIFVVPWHFLRSYLLIAHELGMANGEYAFLCIHGDLFTWKEMDDKIMSDWGWRRNDTSDVKAREIFESVIHILTYPFPKENNADFIRLTNNSNKVSIPEWGIPDGTGYDAYAPYLYDAILTWAIAVNHTLKLSGNPRNGALIYKMVPEAALKTPAVTGDIIFDEPARDRIVNYQILDMYENGTFYVLMQLKFSKDNRIQFHTDDGDNALVKGRWPNGRPPPDIPECGFDGEKCVVAEYNNNYNGTVIGASVSASVVLILAVVVHLMLRKYRRQLTLQSMLWQVRSEEIDFVTAWIYGSIRNSFRHLSQRKPSTKAFRRSQFKGPQFKGRWSMSDIKHVTGNATDHKNASDGSPEVIVKSLDPGAMFGNVAFVRGNLASVKKIQKVNFSLTKRIIVEFNQLIEMKHQNLCPFVGACIEPNRAMLLWEYCAKGSLHDVIWNENIKLDQMFMFALSHDVTKGLEYIHKSSIHYHGNLKSKNCVVDSRWTCKLTDFGLPTIRDMESNYSVQNGEDIERDKYSGSMFWTSPECLRGDSETHRIDRQKADTFALGIILKEVFTRSSPYTEYPFLVPHEIIDKVRDYVKGEKPFRPMLPLQFRQNKELVSLIEDCWHEEPPSRPSAARVLKTLNRINPQNLSMIDNMIVMLEKYANHLEELVAERTKELDAEKIKTENLLYRMLPQTVAEELKLGRPIKAEHFDESTLYFSDIVGFTSICAASTPIEVVNLLNGLYTIFDDIITRYDVYKVETIGDAYMIASGLPKKNGKKHIQEVADCALDILASVSTFCIPHQPEKNIRIRIGIHTGPVVAGVVGLAMPRYCLFGDTVNTASRMESTGMPQRIHLSSMSQAALVEYPGYHLQSRGEIQVKGKGLMNTYFLCGKEGFKKELPKWDSHDDKDSGCGRPSVTSINSMASLVSNPSFNSTTSNKNPKTSSSSLNSNSSNSGGLSDEWDRRYRSKQTSILEVTCL